MAATPAAASAARAFLLKTLQARRQEPGLVMVSVPAQAQALELLWAALPDEPAVLWDPPAERATPDLDTECCLGIGEVTGYETEGPVARFAAPGQRCDALRWLGGQPFAGPVSTPPWTNFPAVTAMLPRWRYTCDATGNATWHLTVHSPTAALIEQVAAEFDTLHTTTTPPLTESAQLAPLRSEPLPFARWQKWLDRILLAIADGQVDKVVAARYTTLVFPRVIVVTDVLRRLRARSPQATRFALRRGGATFLGATPELLVSKRGPRVTTEALAGTLPRTAAPIAELGAQLLASDKDRREHALVVDAIQQRLGPLCHEICAPTVPQLRVLPHLLHLHTPIHATTRAPHTDVRKLVAALHPTPAMGGAPSAAALQLIADHEPQPRGYYAGPVGWWDEHGDGEFAVAIRSGVVSDDTAYVYAGAGIVRGSEPALEYAETAAKMRTLLEALGCPTTDPQEARDE